MLQLEYDRTNTRADITITQLENERALCSLRDELMAACQEIAFLNGRVAKLVRDYEDLQ